MTEGRPATAWPDELVDADPEAECGYLFCDGGYWWGDEFGDPLWYDADKLYPCPSCGGTGLAKDRTLW